MNNKWVYLIILSLIWGSSYILIKKGLGGLSPLQLGGARIVLSTCFLFVLGRKSVRGIPLATWRWIAWSALCGTFLPVFLFAFAETQISSSVASVLNSMTPLFTLLIGLTVFGISVYRAQWLGVLMGLGGALTLIWQGAEMNPGQDYRFAFLVLVAALLYATNANIVKVKLHEVSPMGIALGNFLIMVGPALGILIWSGFFSAENLADPGVRHSMMYVVVLSVLGTGIAKIMFNRLIQMSDPVFSTSVTYLIPVVGIFWGILDNELFNWIQIAGACSILFGVYLVNLRRRS